MQSIFTDDLTIMMVAKQRIILGDKSGQFRSIFQDDASSFNFARIELKMY